MSTKVEEYISKKEKWRKELEVLRAVLIDLPLEETIKWGAPVYVFKGKNVVGLAAFKNYCGLWFFQGALLKDQQKVFVNAQEGKTKAMLQWRFYSLEEIKPDLITEYVQESIDNFKKGKEIKPERNTKELKIPEVLKNVLKANTELKKSFQKLTLSKQREYANYIAEAKREATKLKRLEKITPVILNGVGLHDQYKNC
ncbi:YdeI/OmpD-associated family protein [Polaribacter sp.]|uniref:YdeI/OmpD-associated family protein n=1 Tax=Polaribacter sp. TaxID=1920175 RepID=UPI003F6BA61A